MTDWTIVKGTQQSKPLELEETMSTVYQRRNIEQIEVETDMSDKKIPMWQYEERKMSKSEYSQFKLIEESTKTITSFQEQKVIDAYTEELILGGVL